MPVRSLAASWCVRFRWIAALLVLFAPLGIALTLLTSGWRRRARILATLGSLALFAVGTSSSVGHRRTTERERLAKRIAHGDDVGVAL
jgi:hypothetical protein